MPMDRQQPRRENEISAPDSPGAMLTPSISRRTFLAAPAAAGLGALVNRLGGPAEGASILSAPAVILQASRPTLPSGVASGDVTDDSAIIWSRTDRPARMLVEWSTTSSFSNKQSVRGPLALSTSE